MAAPAALEAKGGSGALVIVEWAEAAGAHHYQVERKEKGSTDFIPWATHVTSNRFEDTRVINGDAYLYQVRAVDAAGRLSPPSNVDLAAAVAFTDDPLDPQVSPSTGSRIKAEHLVQLRLAVNAVRSLVGLPPATWTYPDPVSSPSSQQRKVFLKDVLELRSALDEALGRLGLGRPYEIDPNLSGGLIRAAHFQELRDRVK